MTPDHSTWGSLLDDAAAALTPIAGDRAAVEARWIVCEASGLAAAELVLAVDEPATNRGVHEVAEMVARRGRGEPLQYVIGSWEFCGIDLMVDPRVLIPRPETEVVAGIAIDELERAGARTGKGDPWSAGVAGYTIADLGTGSGALALALVTSLPDAAVWATDASDDALAVARANLSSVGFAATRVRLVQGDWFDALPLELRGELRLVVSNPPYVSEAEFADLPTDVAAYEPTRALVSGPTGLECLEVIVRDAPQWLTPDGVLVCEHAPHQAEAVRELAAAAGFTRVDVRPDLTGRARVLVAARDGPLDDQIGRPRRLVEQRELPDGDARSEPRDPTGGGAALDLEANADPAREQEVHAVGVVALVCEALADLQVARDCRVLDGGELPRPVCQRTAPSRRLPLHHG